jgi:aminoglycoside/choline kinase family phosphotransferase
MAMEKTGDPSVEISAWVSKSRTLESVKKIPGDASTRKYYRVRFRKPLAGTSSNSCIVMKAEPFVEQGLDLPFLLVRTHFESCGVRVPRVYDVDPARGLVLLEDLGDVTLLRQLQEVSNAEVERHAYEKVIDGLVQLHVCAGPTAAKADILKKMEAFRLRFDFEKLMWEVNHTIEHFYEQHLRRVIEPLDRQVMSEGFGEICRRLAAEPVVLTHRDFHSRNVMHAGGEYVMIDFQDARMGPAQYDLASLLKDSYYQLEELQIQRLVDHYIARFEAVSGTRILRQEFIEIFDLMAVQRNFKAIGSFASFLNRRGDATYLKYIGNTFENIRRTLLKYPAYSRLREVLFHYYYF